MTKDDALQIPPQSQLIDLARGHLSNIWTPAEGTTPESRAAKATKALGYSFGDLMVNVQRALREGDLPFLQQFNEAMGEEKTPPAATAAVPGLPEPVANKLLVEMEVRELMRAVEKDRQARLAAKEAERLKPATPQEKQDIAFPSWLPGAAVVALIVLGVWWFNYSDHAQNVRDEGLMKSATISAEAMHRAPPRTKEEAVRILNERVQQLDRYIEKKYGPDAQQNADRERDDYERDRQNDSYRE